MNALSLRRYWQWIVLFFVVLISRLYLLRVYDVELSQDGFEAVRTLTLAQAQGLGAVPRDLLDRFILHPLYMLLLVVWRALTPGAVDFYLSARLLSALLAGIAVILLFEFTRRAYGNGAAWISALLLAFAPSFLWESVTILSSTLFLALYLAVLLALLQSRFRIAAILAFLAANTRYEGVVLFALVLLALALRDGKERWATPFAHFFNRGDSRLTPVMPRDQRRVRGDWLVALALVLAFPVTLVATGFVAAGNPLEFLGAQSMASIWLRFLAPGDFFKRGLFFITQYPALFPAAIVALGVIGALIAMVRRRTRTTALLITTTVLYVVFFEVLVWFNYTTLEVRFLMYPGLPLLVFAGVALATACDLIPNRARILGRAAISVVVLGLLATSYQQGMAGMQFQYNMMASQKEMAGELAQIVPPNQTTNLLAYTGNSGALELFGRQRGLQFTFTDFRFAPDENAEQFLIDHKIQYVVYPAGNAFARAKFPYLTRFETQTHGAVTFRPLTQFATSADNQLYSIWSLTW